MLLAKGCEKHATWGYLRSNKESKLLLTNSNWARLISTKQTAKKIIIITLHRNNLLPEKKNTLRMSVLCRPQVCMKKKKKKMTKELFGVSC